MYRQALRIKAVGICIDDCLTENDANIRGVKLLMRIEPVTCNSKGLGGPGIDNSQSGYFKMGLYLALRPRDGFLQP